jgi:uncharacterized protein (DUF2147 family)
MNLYRFCGVCAVALSALIGTGTAHADPNGVWLAEDGGRVRIIPCNGDALCAIIVTPKAGGPTTDSNNPDPAQRGRSLVGVAVLISMRPDGPGKWRGVLYSTDNGQIYDGRLLELDQRTIRVEGCAIGICGGRNLVRVQ